jgi:hypothetical protein
MLPMVRADISYIFIMLITSVLSYLSQRFFTFKSTADTVADMPVEDFVEV